MINPTRLISLDPAVLMLAMKDYHYAKLMRSCRYYSYEYIRVMNPMTDFNVINISNTMVMGGGGRKFKDD